MTNGGEAPGDGSAGSMGSAGSSGGASTAGTGGAANGGTGGDTKCALEICNGHDDDCNGVVDEGCPSALLRAAVTSGPTIGESTGGGPYSATCASDELLVGLQVGFSNWLEQVNAKCEQFSLAVDKTSTPYEYSVALGSSHLLAPYPPTTSDTTQALNCPSGKVLVGFSIAQQHTLPTFTPDYIVITSIAGKCADLVLDLTSAPPKLHWKNATNIGPISGAFYDSALATTQSLLLDTNQISVGYQGKAGLWVDRIGPIVSSVQLVSQ